MRDPHQCTVATHIRKHDTLAFTVSPCVPNWEVYRRPWRKAMEARWCTACGQPFQPRPQAPSQSYCGQPDCQRARKLLWQRTKRKSDPDYMANQADAQRAWSQRNPEYWRQYRAEHPEYMARNRAGQRRRDKTRYPGRLGKMDASPVGDLPVSGIYHLMALAGDGLAKMDAWIVQLSVLRVERTHR